MRQLDRTDRLTQLFALYIKFGKQYQGAIDIFKRKVGVEITRQTVLIS